MSYGELDMWLQRSLRHAPDASEVSPPGLDDSILRAVSAVYLTTDLRLHAALRRAPDAALTAPAILDSPILHAADLACETHGRSLGLALPQAAKAEVSVPAETGGRAPPGRAGGTRHEPPVPRLPIPSLKRLFDWFIKPTVATAFATVLVATAVALVFAVEDRPLASRSPVAAIPNLKATSAPVHDAARDVVLAQKDARTEDASSRAAELMARVRSAALREQKVGATSLAIVETPGLFGAAASGALRGFLARQTEGAADQLDPPLLFDLLLRFPKDWTWQRAGNRPAPLNDQVISWLRTVSASGKSWKRTERSGSSQITLNVAGWPLAGIRVRPTSVECSIARTTWQASISPDAAANLDAALRQLK